MKQTIALQCSDQIAEAFLRRALNELEAPDRIREQPFRMSENENEHNFRTIKKQTSFLYVLTRLLSNGLKRSLLSSKAMNEQRQMRAQWGTVSIER